MNGALFLLIGLHLKAWGRRLTRSVKTVRGCLVLLVGVGLLTLVAISQYATRDVQPLPPDVSGGAVESPLRRFGAVGILLFTCLSLFASAKHRGVFFSPAEVDVLFPGPFTRRQLLGYRLVYQAIQNALSCLFMTFFLGRYFGSLLQAYVGLFLTFLFLALAQQAMSLLAGAVHERLTGLGRRLMSIMLCAVLIGLVAGVAAVVRSDEPLETLGRIVEMPPIKVLLAPFQVFAGMFGATVDGTFLRQASVAVGIDVALVFIILALDVEYRDAAIETSRKVYARLERMRRGRMTSAVSSKLRLPIPELPWLGGAGPIAWRQIQETVRESPATLYLLFIFGAGALVPMGAALFSRNGGDGAGFGALFGPVAISPLILSNWFRFDFRGDLDHMERLRTLPIPESRIALGQVVAPTLALTVIQVAAFAVIAAMAGDPWRSLGLGGIVLAAPVNFLFVCLENVLFLLYPMRSVPNSPGDVQNLARAVLAQFVKMLILLVVGALCAGLATAVYFVTNESLAATVLVAAVSLIGVDIAALRAVGWAFRRFDVTMIPPQ